jgi:hypothetical protein
MCWEFFAAFAVGWIWGVVFVCAKPMLDLILVIRSPFFVCPRNWRSTIWVIRRAFLSAFSVWVDAAAGRVTGRVLNVDSDY